MKSNNAKIVTRKETKMQKIANYLRPTWTTVLVFFGLELFGAIWSAVVTTAQLPFWVAAIPVGILQPTAVAANFALFSLTETITANISSYIPLLIALNVLTHLLDVVWRYVLATLIAKYIIRR